MTSTGDWKGKHVVVTTIGTLKNFAGARDAMDLSALRVIVINDADFFFKAETNKKEIEDLTRGTFNKLKQKIQWVLFSATYPEEVIEEINKFVTEAVQIKLGNSLTHIKQFVIQCPPKGKAELLVEFNKLLAGTQSIIFCNTRDSVLSLQNFLKKNCINAAVMFSEMDPEERVEMMWKFREGEVHDLITTDVMARGIDVSAACEFVINYDVPTMEVGKHETYLHRISRAGQGIALTLLDR